MQIHTQVQTLPPSVSSDGVQKNIRGDKYGAPHVRSEIFAWAEEGSYFRTSNATIGTGVAMGIQTSFSATANVLFLMRNTSASKVVIPHYIRLVNTAAGASTTSSNIAIVTDTANRYSSGGTDLAAQIVNAATTTGASSSGVDLRYNCTAASAVAARTVGRAVLKTQAAPCWTVGDEVLLTFGEVNGGGLGPLSGTATVSIQKSFGPVVLGGQNHCLLVHMWNPANATTAPSWEFELAWWER